MNLKEKTRPEVGSEGRMGGTYVILPTIKIKNKSYPWVTLAVT